MNPYHLFTSRSQVEELDSDEEYDPSDVRYADEVLTEDLDLPEEEDEYDDEFDSSWDLSPFHVIRFVFTDSTEDEGYGEFVFELPLSPITFSLASSLLYDVERLVIDRIREEQLQEMEQEEERKKQEARGVTEELLQKLPVIEYTQTEEEDVCAICLSDFENGESLKVLPCTHHFHPDCIDRWLLEKRLCPLCKSGIGNSVKEMMELFQQKQEQVNIMKRMQTPRSRIQTPRSRLQTPKSQTPRTPKITSASRTPTQRPATSRASLTSKKPKSSHEHVNNSNNNSTTTPTATSKPTTTSKISPTSKKPTSTKALRKSESTSSLPPATRAPARTASITKKSEIPSSLSKLPPIKSPRTIAEKPKSSKLESLPKRL